MDPYIHIYACMYTASQRFTLAVIYVYMYILISTSQIVGVWSGSSLESWLSPSLHPVQTVGAEDLMNVCRVTLTCPYFPPMRSFRLSAESRPHLAAVCLSESGWYFSADGLPGPRLTDQWCQRCPTGWSLLMKEWTFFFFFFDFAPPVFFKMRRSLQLVVFCVDDSSKDQKGQKVLMRQMFRWLQTILVVLSSSKLFYVFTQPVRRTRRTACSCPEVMQFSGVSPLIKGYEEKQRKIYIC